MDGASNLGGALPNNLGEVRVGGVVGVIILSFRHPIVDCVGDGVTIAAPGEQVL